VVLEAARYPREKYCAGALGGRGEKILADLDASPDVPSVPIEGISLRVVEGETSARVPGIGRVVRRIEFDAALAALARDAGVAIEEDVRVSAVTPRAEGGARIETSRGALDAAIVLGCDGVGSAVRRSLGLSRGAFRAQVLEIDTEPVASDRERAFIHFDASDRRLPGYTWDFPTVVGGESLVCRGIYHLRIADESVDIVALFAERLAAMGLDLAKYKNKRFAERGYELEGPLGDGAVMLVGEAAGIDPVTGEGIAQAIEYGDLAARFLVAHAERGVPITSWTDEVRSSRLGRDLMIRTRAVPAFYSASRPNLERFLLDDPDALRLGCQHFGGKPYERGKLAWMLLRGGGALIADVAQRLWGGGDRARAESALP
jgi:flavin-dependent dehydrogenase